MRPENMTDYYRADLQRRVRSARQAVAERTEAAREAGVRAPETGQFDDMQRLWVKGGYWAGLFCLWFAFLAPIVLILTHWDQF
ncbi:hypothetical protein [Jannaschia sp. LMIT008]|uniref:hypothetical protein n=1 Tax=Jannaschia maritima TaxID=3032585 RepID=UPI002811F3C5|nr:hypothetical protein [Jannaschia sp. LMIT008]